MKPDSKDYSLFFKFIEAYKPTGFIGIDRDSSLMRDLENLTEVNNQFFYIADVISIQIIFTSRRSVQMLGVNPEDLSLYHFMEATHPDDLQRLNLGRSKIIKMGQELYIAGKGEVFFYTNFRVRNASGGYSNLLIQNYLFYTQLPYKTVFFLKIHTNIDWFKKLKDVYHFQVTNNLLYFRYPDEEILSKGNLFTTREFEIIRLIGLGMSSEEISKKLFISAHTVNTHRRNVLIKSGKDSLSELIYDLKDQGML